MAESGVGLWLALKHSATICLYHTETFRHLQDINIASNVSRVLAAREVAQPPLQRSIHVTALMASRGLLWVGTNVGIALTVPLPRLEGVPIISGRANISYHAHFGPVTFFLNLQHKVVTEIASNPGGQNCYVTPSIQEESEQEALEAKLEESKLPLKKQYSDSSSITNSQDNNNQSVVKMRHRNTSPNLPRRRSRENSHQMASRRTSKTLPRGFSLTHSSDMSSMDYADVFGLYGELLNVRDYDCESSEIVRQGEDLRKSDPELSTIPYRVSTLDRRVKMKTSRPRSLDMSSWSVESRASEQTTSSSEAGSERPSPNVSRNASFQSTSTEPSTTTPSEGSGSSPVNDKAKSETVTKRSNDTTKSNGSSKSRKKQESARTVTTLMGGRGYINWRRTAIEKQRTSAFAQVNNCDAFLVIWEMKL